MLAAEGRRSTAVLGGEYVAGSSVDQQLVDLLKSDPRASYADLGVQVGLSGDAVRDRLKRLMAQGQLQIVGSVSPAVYGFHTFALVALKVHSSNRLAGELLSAIDRADLVVSVAGRYDFIVQLACRDDDELLGILDEMRSIEGAVVEEVFTYLAVEKYPTEKYSAHGAAAPQDESAIALLTEADRALIRRLQLDGRASFRDLHEASGLTYTSTRRRVRWLLESGVVQVLAIENPLRGSTQAMVGMNVQGPLGPVNDALQRLPEVEVVIGATGSFDLLVEVTCTNRLELARLVGEDLRSIAGVSRLSTFPYLEVVKLPYAWAGGYLNSAAVAGR